MAHQLEIGGIVDFGGSFVADLLGGLVGSFVAGLLGGLVGSFVDCSLVGGKAFGAMGGNFRDLHVGGGMGGGMGGRIGGKLGGEIGGRWSDRHAIWIDLD